MDGFDALFRTATANISREYFLLLVVESPAIHRERVYCCELYHQLRRIWPDGYTSKDSLRGIWDGRRLIECGDGG